MIRFECDYTEGAHPKILERLVETNLQQTPGYGVDEYCEHARALIREACATPEAGVHFLVGGTQTNKTIISSILRPYQGVIASESGHIAIHEAGAIEATGHKVICLTGNERGKLTGAQIRAVCDAHYHEDMPEHAVQPGMVYISQPTEYGTLYTLEELQEVSRTCKEYGLPLMVDGARLGYGLVAERNDVGLPELASLCDVFYIGGTKVGALFGEAVVFTNLALNKNFRYHIKQNGGMLAKGRLLGIQFETLFTDGLYLEIARHADQMAMKLQKAFESHGVRMRHPSTTNQIFPILSNKVLEKIAGEYTFSHAEVLDETHTVARFCTCWATKEENVDKLIQDLPRFLSED